MEPRVLVREPEAQIWGLLRLSKSDVFAGLREHSRCSGTIESASIEGKALEQLEQGAIIESPMLESCFQDTT